MLHPSDFLAYTSIIVALTLAPGPLIAIIVSRSLNKDISGAFAVGVAGGDVLTILMLSAGLGIWVQSAPELFLFAKSATLAYLLYLAYKMWVGPKQEASCLDKRRSGVPSSIVAGMITCIATPQTILLYLLLLPRFVDVTNISMTMVGYISIVTFAAIILSLSGVVLMVRWLSMLHGSTRDSQFMNRTLSLVIAASGLWIVTG